MKEATLIALNGSIGKWEAIVAGVGEDLGSTNCALCQRFNGCQSSDGGRFLPCSRGESGEIETCPVELKTGRVDCKGSPYEDRATANVLAPKNRRVKEMAHHAQRELDFLKSLLPVEGS